MLASLRLLKKLTKIILRIPLHDLRPAGILVTLFELRDPPSEKIIDDLELAHPSLEGRGRLKKAIVRLRRLEVTIVEGGRRTWGWMPQVEGRHGRRWLKAMIGQGNAVEEVLRRNVRRMMDGGRVGARNGGI